MLKPTINKIEADIAKLTVYLRSTKKFGKSTLFRDMILAKYGDPSYGLLVCCGNELGATLLDGLNVTTVNSYRDLEDLKVYLINKVWIERDAKGKVISKEKIDHNIKIVAFDTGDELCLIADEKTLRIDKIDNPTKKVKSIKGAMGGYTAGEKYSANNLIKPFLNELKRNGFGWWVIAHTKFKSIKEKGSLDTEGYMQLTSNLGADYESAFGDIADVVLTGVIDKNIEEVDSGDSKKRIATGEEERRLYFRGTSLIDAGGRFAFGSVPEYMIFDKPNMGEEFVKVVEKGMEGSKLANNGNNIMDTIKVEEPKKTINKPTVTTTKVEESTIEKDIDIDDFDDDFEEETTVEVTAEMLKPLIKDATKVQKVEAKKVLTENNMSLGNATQEVLEAIYEIVK